MKDYFDVERGFRIDTAATFTTGTGDPTADEPVGSVYLEDDGTFWQKVASDALAHQDWQDKFGDRIDALLNPVSK